MKSRYDFSKAVIGKYAGKVTHDYRIISSGKPSSRWNNASVRKLAGDRDPIELIVEKAREIVLKGMDEGDLTLPIDPFKLAERLSININPTADVLDARTVAGPRGVPIIEYNPRRSRTRTRFSICHEIAHTLFPDCTEQIRHRSPHSQTSPIDNEVEMLCNLAAAEFLLPVGSFTEDMSKLQLSIENVVDLRLKYEASVESILLRVVGLSGTECAVFSAMAESEQIGARYKIEYVKSAGNWETGLRRGGFLPVDSVAKECVAIGHTARSKEEWAAGRGKYSFEMVGIAPYPNRVKPRVVGLIRPLSSHQVETSPINVVRGDALEPRGKGLKIIAHVVNDKTPAWGAGFGRNLSTKWPETKKEFSHSFRSISGSKLGKTSTARVTDDILTFQMICQHGYGHSSQPRLKYGALQRCLEILKDTAKQMNASVHMPMIGTGEAGGSWGIVSNLIAEELCSKGVSVTVYQLPGTQTRRTVQEGLFDSASIY
jgi:Zn-dependent peptidase ImmA (M78 family)/O-acetyl-ADP-ribose deacetylase (regulator of RNase III)